jgi:hypothetical protein
MSSQYPQFLSGFDIEDSNDMIAAAGHNLITCNINAGDTSRMGTDSPYCSAGD